VSIRDHRRKDHQRNPPGDAPQHIVGWFGMEASDANGQNTLVPSIPFPPQNIPHEEKTTKETDPSGDIILTSRGQFYGNIRH
jgi:hypothetical protein